MIEFIRELNRNYLSIVHEDEREPDYTMKMVENNSISGLLSLRKSVVNNRTSYLYDISGCIPLEEKYINRVCPACRIYNCQVRIEKSQYNKNNCYGGRCPC